MIIEVLKCKDCNNIMVVDIKKLWHTKTCSACESRNIIKYDFDEEEIIE